MDGTGKGEMKVLYQNEEEMHQIQARSAILGTGVERNSPLSRRASHQGPGHISELGNQPTQPAANFSSIEDYPRLLSFVMCKMAKLAPILPRTSSRIVGNCGAARRLKNPAPSGTG
jgi:hypothetical protein